MAKAIAEDFVFSPESCNEFQNAGSIIKVASLVNCANEPLIYSVTAAAAGALGDDELDVYLDPLPVGVTAPSLRLEAGSYLYFGATFVPVIVDETVNITATTSAAAQTIAVRPLTAAVTANAVAQTWGMVRVASPTDIPLNFNTQTTDRHDLTFGLQQSQVTTAVELQSALQFIATSSDPAIWSVIHPSTQSGKDFYTFVEATGGLFAFGKTKGSNLSYTGAIKEIKRGSVTLMFQAPFAFPSRKPYLSAAQQARLDAACRLAGSAIASATL